MRKVTIQFLIWALFAAVAPLSAQTWYSVQGKSSSDPYFDTITTADYLQFSAAGTFTVDESISAGQMVFGSGSTVISPANVVINSGQTLSISYFGANTGRLASTMNISGAGNLTVRSTTLSFVEMSNSSAQTYNFAVTGTFSLANKTVNINNHNYVDFGTVTTNATILNMYGDSTLNINSNGSFKTIAMSGTSALTVTGSSFGISSSGGATFADGTKFTVNASSVSLGGTITIGNVAASKLGATIYVEDNANIISNASASTLLLSSIYLKTNSTLTLNTSNAFCKTVGGAQSAVTLGVSRSGAKLIMNADQNFNGIWLNRSDYADTFTVDTNGYNLNLTTITMANGGSKVLIEDFAEGAIYVKNTLAENEDGSVVNVFAFIDSVETKVYQLDTGYLTLSIPEPAEWAAIFGAIAIGFALYRRRRS